MTEIPALERWLKVGFFAIPVTKKLLATNKAAEVEVRGKVESAGF